jgi:hypothetical protein
MRKMPQWENALEPETSILKSNAESAPSSADIRLPRRALVAGLLFVILAIVGTVVVLQLLFVNRIPELTEADLDDAERLWARTGPASYDMDLVIRGAQPGSVHIEVRNFEVTKMTRDGRAPQRRTWDVWSVPGQFETLERELELAEDPVHEMQATQGTQLQLRADFDPKYGFPRQYHRYVSGGGPEVYWSVTSFTPK